MVIMEWTKALEEPCNLLRLTIDAIRFASCLKGLQLQFDYSVHGFGGEVAPRKRRQRAKGKGCVNRTSLGTDDEPRRMLELIPTTRRLTADMAATALRRRQQGSESMVAGWL